VKFLGKQRSKILRSKANQLMELYGDKFTDDFDKNKLVLKEMGIFNSTTDRNICAGIIVKMAKPKQL
jgi:ribosomal protein S17E